MGEISADGPARALLLTAVDSLIAEMLNGSAALADLLGQNPDLGHALMNLVELFLGSEVRVTEGEGTGINRNYDYYYQGQWLPPNAFMSLLRDAQCE